MRRSFAISVVAPLALLLGGLAWFDLMPVQKAPPPEPAADRMPQLLEAKFHASVQPFLQAYCVECHGGARPKAELDLSTYTSVDSVTKDPRRWSLVMERLKAAEMPPDDADKQPTAAERKSVVGWIWTMNAREARRHADDPGIVLARRLSNAEYDHTIRDLTGMDLRPTREFPVDPANEAGFDNSGESLAMSPALVKKYLTAAQFVADHIVFQPDGFTFAPFPVVTDEDRDKYAVKRIVDFYGKQSLDYADFFAAAWRFQHRTGLGRDSATLEDFAREARVSPKYAGKVWAALNEGGQEVGPMAALQARWRALPAPVDGREPAAVRQGCLELREFVVKLRPLLKREFPNLVPNDNTVSSGSQTMVLWKDEQYAINRMTYPGNALQLDLSEFARTDPPMTPPADEEARRGYEASFRQFCALFPDAFYVSERPRMFLTNPKDIASDLQGHRLLTAGFHSQMGYFRDDAPLCELVLDEAGKRELDRLWRDLDFVADVPFRQFRQFIWYERTEAKNFMMSEEFNSFRSEDADVISEVKLKQLGVAYEAKAKKAGISDTALQAVRDYFVAMNASIRALEQAKRAAEPAQLAALVDFATRAYRRPLTAAEREDLLAFYRTLRAQKLSHEEAIHDTVVSVLMAPAFSFRVTLPNVAQGDGEAAVQPLTDYELASRLSYFLWASMPDRELLQHAAAGDLHEPAVLVAQARRMMQDERVRGLATEFGGNWLDIRRFEEHNAVDRDRFPQFTNELRTAMFEEPMRFFTDLVQRNGSVLDFVDGDYTFVNRALAAHYGMPVPAAAAGQDGWARVDEAHRYERGGLLPMAAFLTQNAPGLRTSPVKRGHWFVTRVLGEHIPAPPPNVPAIPTDETKLGNLTLRETLARHREDKTCASCHAKFDSFGLVFEGFGPVGDVRTKDLAGRPVETSAVFPDGSEGSGLAGLRTYFHARVQDEFLDNLGRKLMVYALGRSLQPSDDFALAAMHQKLSAHGYRFGDMVEAIVTSRQFLTKRGGRDPAPLAQVSSNP
jgi:hypothetical protein